MLGNECKGPDAALSLLLAGLLIDGIESAEARNEEIFKKLIIYGIETNEIEQFRPIISSLRICIRKDPGNEKIIVTSLKVLSESVGNDQKICLALIALSLNKIELKNFLEIAQNLMQDNGLNSALFNLFFTGKISNELIIHVKDSMELFWLLQDLFTGISPYSNFISAVGQSITYSMGLNSVAKRAFELQLVALSMGFSGPSDELMLNSLEIGYNYKSSIKLINFTEPLRKEFLKQDSRGFRKMYSKMDRHTTKDVIRQKLLKSKMYSEPFVKGIIDQIELPARGGISYRIYPDAFLEGKNEEFWQKALTYSKTSDFILDLLIGVFDLKPEPHWRDALRSSFLPSIPQRNILFEKEIWNDVEISFKQGHASKLEKYFASWQLILDAWLKDNVKSDLINIDVFSQINELTRELDDPCLRIAHCIRDIAYGNNDRLKDLSRMVNSKDLAYKSIFEKCHWSVE